MECCEVVYERTLTELEPFQSSSELRYMLDDAHNGARRYGVRISQSMRGRVNEARCSALCCFACAFGKHHARYLQSGTFGET